MSPANPQSAEFSEQLETAGSAFGRASVEAIYCIHGTFAGPDAIGLLTELARFAPDLSKALNRFGKRAVDLIARETGNYTPQFVKTLQDGLSQGAGNTVAVRLFNWSSQNNHIGRADGAIRLISELARFANDLPKSKLHAEQPPRILLWGHSHGGNVIALLSNLLAAECEARNEFFHAARTFFKRCFWRGCDLPVWQQVCELLDDPDHALRRLAIDVVTFGTPVRYAFDGEGYDQLLHFIHHRPTDKERDYLAPHLFPHRALSATDGDYVQQVGIAGTNLAPVPLAVRTFMADWRLDGLLERDVPRELLVRRLAHRKRVHDMGINLLVDYSEVEWGIHQHLAGHALYTRRKWLPFHCQQIAERFYS